MVSGGGCVLRMMHQIRGHYGTFLDKNEDDPMRHQPSARMDDSTTKRTNLLSGDIKEHEHHSMLSIVRSSKYYHLVSVVVPILGVVVLGWTVLHVALKTSPRMWYFHGNIVASLLNVYDGYYYVNTDDNPLYRDLLLGTFYHYESPSNANQHQAPDTILVSVTASPSTLTPRGNLTVRWNGTLFAQDVLIFLCDNSSSSTAADDDDDELRLTNVTDPTLILEAATLGQAYTSSVQNGGNALNHNEWFLPRFPVLRYNVCRFVLYRKVRTKFYKLAHSNGILLHQHPQTPVGVHLAYTADPAAVTVHFQSGWGSDDNTNVVAQPVVRYYTVASSDDDDDAPDWTYVPNNGGTTTTTTYTARDLCQAPANQVAPGQFTHPGALHAVTLDNLEAWVTYRYQVGVQWVVASNEDEDDYYDANDSNEDIVWSEEVYEFTAAREPGDYDNGPFSYLVYGDQGCPRVGKGWTTGRDWMAGVMARSAPSRYPLVMLHHFGDLSYAMGAAHQWDAWLDMMEVAAARIPLHIAVGNHEYCYASGVDDDSSFRDPSGLETAPFAPEWGNFHDDSRGECGVPTAARFQMPQTGNGIFWFSHEYALVHTVTLSSEHNMTEGSPQYDWLAQDLAATDRSVTPWLVVELHRPLYNAEIFWRDNTVGVGMRGEIEHLLLQYKVDLVLAGHYHSYLRTCDQLYQSRCGVQGAPMHVTIGTAGVGLDHSYHLYNNEWTRRFINTEYGYGKITVYNATVMQLEFLRAGGVDEAGAGATLDDVYLVRDRT